jgi:serine phosphatase RsbU (regulator of sigma subunit)/CHASE2 domain-containing sensor protein
LTSAAAAAVPAPRRRRIRWIGAALVAALAATMLVHPRWMAPLSEAWFDGCQRLFPREVAAMPATVIEVDGPSLAAFGRWPWPRSLLADLLLRVGELRPAVIGVDILMPEADPLSPERLLQRREPDTDPLAPVLGALPGNDVLLARALSAAPSVLAVAGMPEMTGMALRAPPFAVRAGEAGIGAGDAPLPDIMRFAGALTSVDVVNRAAAGWGLVSADPVAGVIRSVPLVAAIDGTLIPAFAIEMLRVAAGAPALWLVRSGRAVQGVGIAKVLVPTAADGSVRLYFSHRDARRFVSAADVLNGRVDPERLRDKLVIVAVTSLGLGEYHYTPVGERMPGSEIHAQLLENLYEGTLLSRPAWGPALEAAVFAALAALLVWATPAWPPRRSLALALACVAALPLAAAGAFVAQRLLLDAVTPMLGLALVFGTMLVSTLTESARHRRSLEEVVQLQREQHARLAGELDAGRRIQTAMLPRVESLGRDPRLDLAVTMLPAREVGGDLYDFFRLGERHLFVLVGDVAGKGLSASIFMAVSKALVKSATLRLGLVEPGALMSAANAEVSRDNPELLFVTAFAAIIDLETGGVVYCNAGHEDPFRIAPGDAAAGRLGGGDGPPLCAVDDFAYRGARAQLKAGELVCIVTDGVTEARSPENALYGSARIAALLRTGAFAGDPARAVVDALVADVTRFASGAAQADDLTVLALRWNGPATRAS